MFINKTLRLNYLKSRTAMNVKFSVFVICVKDIIYLLLHNLHDCTFNLLLSIMHQVYDSQSSALKVFSINYKY